MILLYLLVASKLEVRFRCKRYKGLGGKSEVDNNCNNHNVSCPQSRPFRKVLQGRFTK